MLTRAFLAAIVGLQISSALAQDGRYVIWGQGSDTCSKFLQERPKGSLIYASELSWIEGFVSEGNGEWITTARKAGVTIDVDFLKGLDHAALENRLVDICRQDPSKNLSGAASALQLALIEKIKREYRPK